MKIVIDTNIIASAIFFGGKPRQLVEMLMADRIESYASEEIIDEYKDTISYLQKNMPQKQYLRLYQ